MSDVPEGLDFTEKQIKALTKKRNVNGKEIPSLLDSHL